MAYIGNIPVPQATQTRDRFTATSGQTTFATSGYTPGFLDVYLNGVHLDASDYTATNGSDVVLDTGAATDDIVEVVAFTAFTPANIDAVSAANGGTFSGAITVDADGATVATFDRATSDGTIIDLQKDGSSVGSIASSGGTDLAIGSGDTGFRFIASANEIIPWNASGNTTNQDAIDIGKDTQRFKDLYLSGGVYLGGTGAANHLDDYEYGSGTPTVGMTTSGTVTITGGNYEYTKIGNICHFSFEFQTTGVSSPVGALRVNLPFTVPSGMFFAGSVRIYNNTFTGSPFIEATSNDNYVKFRSNVSGAVTADIVPDSGSGHYFFGQITYRTA